MYTALILSNSCYYIGTKLSACPEVTKDREDILHILLNLMRFCPRDVGRQLASSNCVSLLFNQLLQEDLESFGKTAIESVLARTSLSNTCCEFLCSFAQDAWSGDQQGADMLQSQAKIIASLKHFIYDTQTMVYLCQRDTFIQVVLNHIRLFLAGNTVKCTVQDSRMGQTAEDDQEKYEQEEQKGPENQAEKHDKTVSQEGEQENQEKLHKNFLVKWQEGGVSPNQHYHNLWSPSMSPNALPHSPASSPGMTEDSRASSSGSFLDDFGFLDEFSSAFSPTDTVQPKQDNEEDNAAYSDDGGDSEDHKYDNQEKAIQPISEAPTKVEFPLHSPPIEFSPHQQKTVAKDCLQIITKLTHQEENYTFLVKQDLLCTLLDVISDAPNLDAQLARSIKRLARSKNTLQTLLEMNFHQMVILKLIRRDCILARFSKPCSRCQTRLKFGQEILQEFVGHADSNLGWYLLQQHLRSEDSNTRQFMPVETLLCTLAYTLQHPQGEEVLTAQQTSVCSHILMSLSSLLTHRLLAGLIPNFQQLANPPAHVPTQRNPCKLAGLQAEDPNNLLFHTSHSECIVPKEDLCEASAYFRGMFQNDFAEKTLNRQNFTLDEQEAAHCSETDYHKFLHYLLGCRDSACVQQISGSTVCAMLYLADKYLCSQLLEELLQVNGLAEKCLDGDSLRHFLVPVLSIQSLGDRLNNLCSYTLLRYTNTQQINATLNQFVGHESAIAALVDLLQNFILQFTTTASENRQPQNSLVRLWDYL
uniref:BTB domain-containing protein n=1 Tax=Ditylenchus dipsaci TaxID=166011 RepID=A0A915DDG7_9BILA